MRGCPFSTASSLHGDANFRLPDGFAMYEGVIESVSDDFHAFVFVTALPDVVLLPSG